jgi:hypothetical protein
MGRLDRDRHHPARSVSRRWALGLGLVSAVAALAFPFAPVAQPVVTYSWSAGDGDAAIPLMPYQPSELRVQIACSAARGAEHMVFSTVPLDPDPAAEPLNGLRVVVGGDRLRISTAGVSLGEMALPRGDCTAELVFDPRHAEVLVDGVRALGRDDDVRPDVAGAFSEVRAGVSATVVTDTRFQTVISPVKAALGALCVLALLGMLVALRAADGPRRVRLLPRGWWRPRLVDAVVAGALGLWWLAGPVTVDDGYIAGIIRSRGGSGFIGNVYRWLNAPEAPFSWFYDLYYAWSQVSTSTVWMRLPSTLLGLLCWWLVALFLVPRLGRRAKAPWLAALAFLTWWIPSNLGLRPEPWVAVGVLAVFLAVERAVATRRVLPLAVGLVVAGASTALTPGGVMAFAPFLAAGAQVLRLLRVRRDVPVVALVAAPLAAVLLMMSYDQSLAAVLEATRVRSLVGGGMPWYQEFERYTELLTPVSFQGTIGRRAAVLFTLLAAVALLLLPASRHKFVRESARIRGISSAPGRRLVVGYLIAVAVMTITPTKWTQHFGDLAGVGAGVLLLGIVAFWTRGRAVLAGTAVVTVLAWLVLAGSNTWPYVSNWYAITWSTMQPQIGGVTFAAAVLAIGGAVVLGLLARSAWNRAGSGAPPPLPRWVPAPSRPVVVLLVALLLLQVGSFARVGVRNGGSYTLLSDAVASLRGQPCGLQPALSVETDPAAGLLPTRSRPPNERPVDVGGVTMPGVPVEGTTATDWFTLDRLQRDRTLPVVVTTSGAARPHDVLTLEFAAAGRTIERRPIMIKKPEPRDVRAIAPAGADAVRLVMDAPPAGTALVSLPRVPRLVPMDDLLPPGSTALLDWPVTFLFACLTPAPLPLGTASTPEWRVAPPQEDPSAEITYSPGFGGPFAASRQLVTERRMATYLRGDPERDPGQLYRWLPIGPLSHPTPAVTVHDVGGWVSEGHARVPGLDVVAES